MNLFDVPISVGEEITEPESPTISRIIKEEPLDESELWKGTPVQGWIPDMWTQTGAENRWASPSL